MITAVQVQLCFLQILEICVIRNCNEINKTLIPLQQRRIAEDAILTELSHKINVPFIS